MTRDDLRLSQRLRKLEQLLDSSAGQAMPRQRGKLRSIKQVYQSLKKEVPEPVWQLDELGGLDYFEHIYFPETKIDTRGGLAAGQRDPAEKVPPKTLCQKIASVVTALSVLGLCSCTATAETTEQIYRERTFRKGYIDAVIDWELKKEDAKQRIYDVDIHANIYSKNRVVDVKVGYAKVGHVFTKPIEWFPMDIKSSWLVGGDAEWSWETEAEGRIEDLPTHKGYIEDGEYHLGGVPLGFSVDDDYFLPWIAAYYTSPPEEFKAEKRAKLKKTVTDILVPTALLGAGSATAYCIWRWSRRRKQKKQLRVPVIMGQQTPNCPGQMTI
jgi:hypothetical protein